MARQKNTSNALSKSRWESKNRAKQNYYSRKSNAKRFILRDADEKAIRQLKSWIVAREEILKEKNSYE